MADAVTIDELKAFLSAKGAEMDCPACKADTWMADIPHGDHITLRKWVSPVEADRAARLRVIMVCANCGFIREHDLDTVLEWKNGQT